ncbi:hypothetical protein CUT44_20025 [Streptomyces carminius]|uniref:Uncharacterized protein n=1 Tax=Streptomyces carminius TaxID=2665496 RepID=A0A2M8LVV0_9ACTN|nr:hypothetical protein [Streptomyces carminius]PJE96082.1 hypothetical protein CUT44_20025 [Streptomyces carminius]
MQDSPVTRTPEPGRARSPRPLARLTRLARWAARRRRAALGLALRGACHGAGTAAAGLVALWLQHRFR